MEEVKTANRITSDDSGLLLELEGLIEAARYDLMITGVSPLMAIQDDDPLIKRAIILYTKAHFGYDNKDAERLNHTYLLLRDKLSMDIDYQTQVVE